jgi:hypothetical protein
VPDLVSVLELYRRTELHALVGFEFFFQEQGDYAPRKVRIDQVNPDGKTFKVMDLGAKKLIEKDLSSGELTVGWATRSENDPVICLLKEVKIDAQPFLDPNLRAMQTEAEEVRNQQARRENAAPFARSAPLQRPPEAAGSMHAHGPEIGRGVRAATPSLMGQF